MLVALGWPPHSHHNIRYFQRIIVLEWLGQKGPLRWFDSLEWAPKIVWMRGNVLTRPRRTTINAVNDTGMSEKAAEMATVTSAGEQKKWQSIISREVRRYILFLKGARIEKRSREFFWFTRSSNSRLNGNFKHRKWWKVAESRLTSFVWAAFRITCSQNCRTRNNLRASLSSSLLFSETSQPTTQWALARVSIGPLCVSMGAAPWVMWLCHLRCISSRVGPLFVSRCVESDTNFRGKTRSF